MLARLGHILADFNGDIGIIDRQFGMPGAQARILRFFQLRQGQVVTKDEISGVAGIHEWARRVRGLREDDGWAIHSATTLDGLSPGEYLLASAQPDPKLAEAWTLARQMRQLKTRGVGASRRRQECWSFFVGRTLRAQTRLSCTSPDPLTRPSAWSESCNRMDGRLSRFQSMISSPRRGSRLVSVDRR